MATIRLIPSTYYLSSSTYLSVSNENNMYDDTDSDTYATVTNGQTGTTTYYIYLRGFNFGDLPSGAIVNSFTVKLRARESGINTSSSYSPKLCHGTRQITSTCSAITTTVQTFTFTNVGADWEDIVGYGSDFGIRINCRRASRNSTGYMYIYGAEIEVDYTIPIHHTVEIQNSTSAVVTASDTNPFEGDNVIISADTISGLTIKDNGVDVTSQFVQGGSDTVTSYPVSYSTSGSISGTRYQQCIGVGVDGSSVSGNDYASGGSGSTAHIDYSFDFDSIPSGASIQSVSVRVKGHCESTSQSSEVATLQLYSGSTAKGSESEFTSTSDQTITMTTGTWTRAELQNAVLRFTIGYYGGAVSGVTWQVTYEVEGYIYTITSIVENHVIVVTSGGSTQILYFKISGTYVAASKVYKKANGSWVQQSDLTNVFDAETNYRSG